jgi:hypothetical protein
MHEKKRKRQATVVSQAGETKGSSLRSYAVLAALTIACLVPFCDKAFHIDDALFVWTAQQILRHPADPYGFDVVWYTEPSPMSQVTENPPAASYYMASFGSAVDWSERGLHLAFLVPALVAILGTYHLGRRFTRNPLLASAATLLTPGFLVSSTNVMCDTMMLAAWILAIIFWLEGLDRENLVLLCISAVLIAICALTKYFGIALIPLLLVYTAIRQRSVGAWAFCLLIPLLVLAAYQRWTHLQYGTGLLFAAAEYATRAKVNWGGAGAKTLVGLSFVGGAAVPFVFFIPVIWKWRTILFGVMTAVVAGVCAAMGWIRVFNFDLVPSGRIWLSTQVGIFLLGGMSVLALVISDYRKRRDADSALLGFWILGTVVFAVFVNWTVNARSVLPLLPAAAFLLARRVDSIIEPSKRMILCLPPLAAAAIVSLWVTSADYRLANSAREAARYVRDHARAGSNIAFEGHWGFQYYMQLFGFAPMDFKNYKIESGNIVVMPENNTNAPLVSPRIIASRSMQSFDVNVGVTTLRPKLGAGFYSDAYGPLPYAFGSVPPERYAVIRLKSE